MSKPLLALCSLPKVADRDGGTGPFARLLLPAYEPGYWFASGKEYTFPTGTALQDKSRATTGVRQANTYTKGAGICLNP